MDLLKNQIVLLRKSIDIPITYFLLGFSIERRGGRAKVITANKDYWGAL